MLRIRVIPVLLLSKGQLVKTRKFRQPRYVGDPINAIKIFNDKEVDELVVLDIGATTSGQQPNFAQIEQLASECFMPLCYGGGVTSLEQMQRIFRSGVEKVALNSAIRTHPDLVRRAADTFGKQALVASIDVRHNWWGKRRVHTRVSGDGNAPLANLPAFVQHVTALGFGEILINSVNRDGTLAGYDLEMITEVAAATDLPIIACGGASSVDDFCAATQAGADAVAAGRMFVFHGKHRAVLIQFPSQDELQKKLFSVINHQSMCRRDLSSAK